MAEYDVMTSGFEDSADIGVQELCAEISSTDTNYISVTTARNEETYLPNSVPSILKQTISINVFMVVDDGS